MIYTSSCLGRKTHASWKKGLFVVFELESRREYVGAGPMSSANASSY